MQKLYYPINKACVTFGYKHPAYGTPEYFKGQTHYGTDVVSENGNRKIYGCGSGIVTHCGLDGENRTKKCGLCLVIVYKDVLNAYGKSVDVAIRYFHMDKINVKVGDKITLDTELGEYGNTGGQTTGSHLHFEIDLDIDYPNYSPSVTSNGNVIKKGKDTTIHPNSILWLKKSYPENQTIKNKYSSTTHKNDTLIREV